jgi:hypothetical protein
MVENRNPDGKGHKTRRAGYVQRVGQVNRRPVNQSFLGNWHFVFLLQAQNDVYSWPNSFVEFLIESRTRRLRNPTSFLSFPFVKNLCSFNTILYNYGKTFIPVIIAQFETISNLDISPGLFHECINNICVWHQTYIS